MRNNLLLMTDSYKVSHHQQYPTNTTNVYSYFESRGGDYPETVFFGLQYLLDNLQDFIPTWADLREADELYEQHFGTHDLFNSNGWNSLLYALDGKLPIRIKAVPEGLVVPTGNVLMTAENTDPSFYWLTNYLETYLSQVWYPITVATVSYHVRKTILEFLERTGTPEAIDFKLHDFGFRGASSLESAAIGGAAHLTSFLGTDTVIAMKMLKDHYGAKTAAGFSVPAAEHSTMTSWGREHEVDAFRNMIQQYGDLPFYAVVSDSYNIYEAAKHLWGEVLHNEVLKANGTLVVRPDSGDPPEVVLRLLEILGDKFGKEINPKGYKVLNPKVRIIWGDGLEPRGIESILFRMQTFGWSADNITFGMGGGLLQKVNRDTQKFAFKCSSVVVDGEERDVYKEPVGMAFKNSKRGRLGLYKRVGTDGPLQTLNPMMIKRNQIDVLETVYENGEIKKRYTLDEIRERVKSDR